MAASPAKQHLSRVRAAEESARRQGSAPVDNASEYELHMMKLQDHRLRLKQIQSGEAKGKFKAQILDDYAPYLQGVLQADAGGDDEVVATLMLWHIDAGDFAGALPLAEYALRHDLAMPDRFARTTGCLIAEEVADAALRAQVAGADFDAAVLDATTTLTAQQDMPDQVRAKLYLAAGRSVIRADDVEDNPPPFDQLVKCVANLNRALELDTACGGKKDLERATRLLKKHAPPAGIAEAPQSISADGDGETGNGPAPDAGSDNAGNPPAADGATRQS
ncbi:terminase [Stenotrophomonas maltophilia]|nr:terminase [Stenotrophomonas maltophilia]